VNKSTLKTIEVLEFIAENRTGVTLTHIAKELNIPKSSTSDILKSLQQKGMVEYTESKSYKIGIKNLLLGNAYLANIDLIIVSTPYINALSEQTGNTIFLAKMIDNRITYLHKREPMDFLVSTCRIGSRAGLTTTALGKVILAYNEKLQDIVLQKPMLQRTKHSITDPETMRQQLLEVKSNGYAIDNREDYENVLCLGFPVFDERGLVEHSIGISGLHHENRDIEREIELGRSCATEISHRLGFQP